METILSEGIREVPETGTAFPHPRVRAVWD
jgi:hypothetical protein